MFSLFCHSFILFCPSSFIHIFNQHTNCIFLERMNLSEKILGFYLEAQLPVRPFARSPVCAFALSFSSSVDYSSVFGFSLSSSVIGGDNRPGYFESRD